MKTYSNTALDIEFANLPIALVNLFSISIDEKNVTRKIKARKSLVSMGRKVIPHMHKLLSSQKLLLRMEAAKIVEQIADYKSIPSLIQLLDDNEFDIRWIAATGLIKIGRRSIIPLLKAVRDGKSSYFLNMGVHHVLTELLNEGEKQKLEQLMKCLENEHTLREVAPTEASKALKTVFRCKN